MTDGNETTEMTGEEIAKLLDADLADKVTSLVLDKTPHLMGAILNMAAIEASLIVAAHGSKDDALLLLDQIHQFVKERVDAAFDTLREGLPH